MAHADQGDDEKERKGGRIADFMETLAELNRGFKEMGLISGEKIENIYDCVQVFKNMYSNGSALQSEQMKVENELKQCQSRINDVEMEKVRVKSLAMESAINESIGIGIGIDEKLKEVISNLREELKAEKVGNEEVTKDMDALATENRDLREKPDEMEKCISRLEREVVTRAIGGAKFK